LVVVEKKKGSRMDGNGMQIAQWVFNGLVTAALAYVAAKNRQISQLKAALKKAAEERIDQKFGSFESACKLTHNLVEQRVEQISSRLAKGEQNFDSLFDSRQKAQLEMAAKIDALKDYIRDHCASKNDVATLSHRIDTLQREPQVRVRT
jgi:hypothetical protein